MASAAAGLVQPSRTRALHVARVGLDNLVWLILILAIVTFSIAIPGFASAQNYVNIVYHAVFIGILAIAETFALVAGVMDLSVESMAGLAAIVAAWLTSSSQFASGLLLNPYLALLVVLGMGAVLGVFNAFFVARLNINAFLVTLSTFIIVRGLALSLTEGRGIASLPPEFAVIDSTRIAGIPLMVYLMVGLYLVFFFGMARTRFGRHVFAIGGNAAAAQNFGIGVHGMLLRVFVLSGILAALAGWLITARSGGASAAAASGFLFETLAAVVIGGVSIQGGRGSLVGVFAGVLLLSAIHSALNMMAISPFVADVVRGSLVLTAVVLDSSKRALDRHLVAANGSQG